MSNENIVTMLDNLVIDTLNGILKDCNITKIKHADFNIINCREFKDMIYWEESEDQRTTIIHITKENIIAKVHIEYQFTKVAIITVRPNYLKGRGFVLSKNFDKISGEVRMFLSDIFN
jgi:hypothetical protein